MTVQLPDNANEQTIREAARDRRIELETMSDFRPDGAGRPPALVLGYAQMSEPAIRAGVHELALAVHAARGRGQSRVPGPRRRPSDQGSQLGRE